ncbi:MAG: hypothetical protein GYB64_14605, partial [Chloroflexi bacterium]|nr:hypothetical protein [Chloroflexota bacterium]
MGWQSAFLQSLSILCLSAVAIAILVSLTALGKVPPPSREDFNREWAGTMRFWGLLAGVLAGVFVGSTALDIVWVGENGWAVQRAQITDVRVEERGTQFVAVIRYDYAGGSGGP